MERDVVVGEHDPSRPADAIHDQDVDRRDNLAADVPGASAGQDISKWDIAAGHALVTTAGDVVTTPSGALLCYGNAAQGFSVPGFIVWGDLTRRIDAA